MRLSLIFFRTGKLPKDINVTTLTFIPKVKCPENVTEFSPITCCSMLYKCITKLISDRLNLIMPDIVLGSQGVFVLGRSILHNVVICQDLVRCYTKKSIRADYMMKLHLKKAYDNVNWRFLQQMLDGVRFPRIYTDLIMICVKTPMFSIMLNGAPTSFF